MSALAAGAETVYLPEEGISLERLKNDCAALVNRSVQYLLSHTPPLSSNSHYYGVVIFNRFKGRTSAGGVGLVILTENASAVYDIEFLKSVFTEEGTLVCSNWYSDNTIFIYIRCWSLFGAACCVG